MRKSLKVLLIENPLLLPYVGGVVVEPALQVVRHVGVLILVIGCFLRILWSESLLIHLHDHVIIREARDHPRFHATVHGTLSSATSHKISAAGVFIAHHQWWLRLTIHTEGIIFVLI